MLPTRGQSDNLALLGVVDTASPALATQAALRWAFRYAFGFPHRVEFYSRARRVFAPVFVGLELGASIDPFVATITGDGTRTAGGLQLAGTARIAFARPMVSIGVVVSATAAPSPSFTARVEHSPAMLDFYPSSAHPQIAAPTTSPPAGHPPAWFTLNGDCIDALDLRSNGPTLIVGLLCVPLHDAVAAVSGQPDWAPIGTLKIDPEDTTVWPAPAGLSTSPPPSASTRSILHDLFHGVPAQPMAQRALTSQASSGASFAVPELGALLLAATQPAEARELNLLVDLTTTGHATAGANDYLANAVWNDTAPPLLLTAAQGIDFAALATATPPPSLGQTYTGDPRALISSSQPLTLVGGALPGLQLGAAGVWVTFGAPQLRVEGTMAANTMRVEATAFATLPNGQARAVDWTATNDPSSFFLQAERIDAVYLAPVTSAPVLHTLRFAAEDVAMRSAPSTQAGQVFAATFALGHLALPSTPSPLTAVTLPDDVGAGQVRVGLSFDVQDQARGLSAGAASYVVSSGPSAAQLQTLVDPLVVPAPVGDPPAYDFFDEVADGDTRVYSVAGRDYFGRLSAPATTAPAAFTNPRPLPPPFDLIATVDPTTTPASVALTWQWPPPNVAADARLKQFNIYWKPGGESRPTTDGTVAAVTHTPGEKGTTFTRQAIVHVTTTIAPAAVDVTQLPGASVRAGDDFYVVDATETIHGSGGDQLALHLCLNPSTPNLMPSVGDAVSIFGPIPAAASVSGAAAYAPNTPIRVTPSAASTGNFGYRWLLKGQPAWPAGDSRGRSTLRFGVSAAGAAAAIESAVCGPVDATSVDTSSVAPPVPASIDESDVYSDPADAFGRSHYRYQSVGGASALYHVYRALDEAVIAECARVGAAGLSAPTGSYPAPIVKANFDAAIAGAPAVVRTMGNLALNVYGNLVGAERAYGRITEAPLTAAASGAVTYDDDTLPGGSVNRYLYRLRALSKSGEPGAWGWASRPVRLYPNPPTRPTLERVEAQATNVLIAWRANPEPEVDTYLLYACTDPKLASDERLMGAPISIDAGDALSTRLSYTLALQPGASYSLRLAAVANHVGLPSLVSAASDVFLVTPHAMRAPLPPTALRATRQSQPDSVSVTFTANPDPTARYMLRRRVAGETGTGTPLTTWQPAAGGAVSLADAAPGAQPCEYLVACTNSSGRIAFSAAVAAP